MAGVRRVRRWSTVVLSVAAVSVMMLAGLAQAGLVTFTTSVPVPAGHPSAPGGAPATPASSDLTAALHCLAYYFGGSCVTVSLPSAETALCDLYFGNPLAYTVLGPACNHVGKGPTTTGWVDVNANITGVDLMIALANYLNITAAATANLNATVQEQLSYFEDRAEAIVPDFVNNSWNNVIADQILTDSGLVPAIEGMDMALSYQQWQDWNATIDSWNNFYGPYGEFGSGCAPSCWGIEFGSGGFVIGRNGYTTADLSRPWEFWVPAGVSGGVQASPSALYFNLMPGGTIVTANYQKTNNTTYLGEQVSDLTTGTNFSVPAVNYTDFISGAHVPIVTTLHNIGQFDLLRLSCSGNCSITGTNPAYVQVSGGYAFENISGYGAADGFQGYVNSMSPTFEPVAIGSSAQLYNATYIPEKGRYVCFDNAISSGSCYAGSGNPFLPGPVSPHVQTEGFAQAQGTGVSSVASNPDALSTYATTFQNLAFETLNMSYAYYEVLRALTDYGKYAIPANCVIPPPSDAFPTDTAFPIYSLNNYDTLAVYLSYLNAVAREYGLAFTGATDFCGDSNLGLTFNWTASWSLRLNITASIYLAGATGPVDANGTSLPSENYTRPGTWALTNVSPSLLYPFEYQLDVPTNAIFPVPINDPLAAVAVNYTGNLYYGQQLYGNNSTPLWGVPTYLSLYGWGNFVYTSGTPSSYASGGANATGAAIDITSCVLNGVPQDPCDIAVTYFNNFTIGIEHGFVSPPPAPVYTPPSLNPECGFNNLNEWYDGFAGYLGSAVSAGFYAIGNAAGGIPVIGVGVKAFFDGLGCIVAWVIIILVLLLLLYIVLKVVISMVGGIPRGRSSGKTQQGGGTATINLNVKGQK